MFSSTKSAIMQQEKQYLARPRELSSEELGFSVKMNYKFSSTGELSRTKDFVGQERALAALDLGLGVTGRGFKYMVPLELVWRSSHHKGPGVAE